VALPAIVGTEPASDALHVPLTAPITTTFNQPMDQASTEAAFALVGPEGAVPGAFTWSGDGRSLGFTPAAPLALGTTYAATFAAGARAVGASGPGMAAATSSFTTVLPARLAAVEPADGSVDVEPYGSIRLIFDSPMDVATLDASIAISPQVNGVYTYWSEAERTYWLSYELLPGTTYTLALDTGMLDPYGAPALNEPQTVTFSTGDYPPQAQLGGTGLVSFFPAEGPTAATLTTRNTGSMDFNLSAVDETTFLAYAGGSYDEAAPLDIARTWVVTPGGVRNERVITAVPLAEGGALAPGLYVVRAYPGGELGELAEAVLVSNIQLTLKAGQGSALAWAIDVRNGAPVTDLPLTIRQMDGSPLASANTDTEGVATFAWDAYVPSWADLAVFSDDPTRVAAASTSWAYGVEPYAFAIEQRYDESPLTAYVTTDRPLYRPGETVETTGIVRSGFNARYTLPSFDEVAVTVYDPIGVVVHDEVRPLSAFGSFTLSLPFEPDAELGSYSVVVRRVDAAMSDPPIGNGYFTLAEYRKPEFNVTVTPAAPEAVFGETVTAELDVRFFFDLPVSGAAVEWRVFGTPTGFEPDVPGGFSFTDPDFDPFVFSGAGLGLIVEAIGTTDADGRATLTFEAPAGDPGRILNYEIQAVVTDPAGDVQVAGRASITAHPAQLAVGVAADRYLVDAGAPVALEVLSLNADGTVAPNQRVRAALERQDWDCAQSVDPVTRQSTWDCAETRTPIDDAPVTTDAQGRASVDFTPDEAGSYRLVATITDSSGREARAAAYVFAVGAGEVTWRQEPSARLELTTDKRAYRPGETLELLIPSPLAGEAVALVTVERDSVLRHQIVQLTGPATTVTLPLTADDAPGVFISAVVVRPGADPDYRLGLIDVAVSPEQQLLTVTATPDRTRARPGEIVRYTLDVRDAAGAPAEAEVAISVADLAALQLMDPNAAPIDEAFYGKPQLGVRTGLSLNVDGELVPDDVWALGRGGGGGGDGALFELIAPRSNFKDTAYWNAQAVTDEAGTLAFEVTLPDNLTTWRLQARAVTEDTRVGATQVDVIASKTLQIRPITPRFFTTGDRLTLKAVVDNTGAEAIEARVLLDASGVALEGPAEQTATVPAGGRVEIGWPIVVSGADAADLTFSAQGGGQFDSTKPTLGQGPERLIPIYRYVAPEVVATSGDLAETGLRVEAIGVPRRFGAVVADLDVRVTPSLMSTFAPALAAIEDPDQPDAESSAGWAARLSANTAVLRALRAAEAQPDLQLVLAGRIRRAVDGLFRLQNDDGGWGFWDDAPSDAWLTATILLGLQAELELEAEDAPYDLPYMLERAAGYLTLQVYQVEPASVPLDSNWELDRHTYTAYALTVVGQDVTVVTDALYVARDRLSAEGQALLALAFAEDDPRARTLIDALTSLADVSATGASWNVDEGAWRFLGSQTRATSVVLSALLRHDPANPLAPNVVRWLMIARRADAWESTQETAWALNALSGWAELTGELAGDFGYQVRLNDTLLLEGAVTAETLAETAMAHTADLIRVQANRLAFERGEGPGRLYYTAALNVVLPAGEAPAVERGLIVSRSYALESTACGGVDQPLCQPITSASVGDTIRVTLSLSTARERHFVVLEDLFPAGAEAIDTSLRTAPLADEPLGLRLTEPDFWWGGWWFGRASVRDDRIRVVADLLPAGSYTYSYLLYLQTTGEFQVRPAQAYTLYAPEVFGRSTGEVFTVTP